MELDSSISRHESQLLLFALVLSFLIGLFSIALPEIGGSSEAREAHIIQLMQRTGDYILPLRNGIIPSKPPLFHWIGSLFAKIAGSESPFTARMPSLLAGLLMLATTMLSALRFAKVSDQKGRAQYMIWSCAILSTTYLFEKMRTVAMVDGIFSAMVTFSIASLVLPHISASKDNPQKLSSIHWSLFYFFAGMAVLAKGPLGIVLPIIFVFPVLLGEYGFTRSVLLFAKPSLGWLIFVLIACPWYVFSAVRQSGEFIGRQIIFENISRFVGGEHITAKPWHFYSGSFIRELMPWSIPILLGVVHFFRFPDHYQEHRRIIRSLYCSILVSIIFFSFADGKRDSYLLPLLPWTSLILTVKLVSWYNALTSQRQQQLKSSFVIFIITILALLLSAVAYGEIALTLKFSPVDPIRNAILQSSHDELFFSGIVLSSACLLVPIVKRFQINHDFVAIARVMSLTAIFSISLAVGFSFRNHFKNFKPVAESINAHLKNQPLTVVREIRDEFFDGILYYLHRDVNLIDPTNFVAHCQGYTLVRYDQFQGQYKPQVPFTVVENYYEIDDQLLGADKNRKVLLNCSPGQASS